MPFERGNRANPGGKPKDKAFADMVRLVISEDDPKRGFKKLRCLANRLYEKAMEGEGWAMAQIADRLDGKPAQESTVTVRNELDQMNDAELRDFIRRELEASRTSGLTATEPENPRVIN